MESEDSRDGNGDAQSSSSSSSSSSRSSASNQQTAEQKLPKSPPESPATQSQVPRSPSPTSHGPRSPSPESRSQSPNQHSTNKGPSSPGNISDARSEINSPETSMPNSPSGDAPKSPNETEAVNEPRQRPLSPNDSPKSLESPNSSAPASPDRQFRPQSPQPNSQPASSRQSTSGTQELSAEPREEWGTQNCWRRKNKAEQKCAPETRSRSRSRSSSQSSDQSASSNNRESSNRDPATEEISEGEMESDQEENKSPEPSGSSDRRDGNDGAKHNMSHEDLSDVSDSESLGPDDNEKDEADIKDDSSGETDENKPVNVNGNADASEQSPRRSDAVKNVDTPKLEKVPQEKTSNTEDGEEQLDFEAEEGECVERKVEPVDEDDAKTDKEASAPSGRATRASSPEEGEVSDEAERRPEETEPRPVCRFFSRGACTWGVSCRFLHPGVTDKGNYSMFDVVRNVPAHGPYPPYAARPEPAAPESAWERGLKTAKEMLRIANKRKEQDIEFEEKKLHLSVGGAVHDPDTELAYSAAAVGASPPPRAIDDHHAIPARPYGPPMYGRPPRFMAPGRPIPEEYDRYEYRERGFEPRERYERIPHYDDQVAAADELSYKRRVRSSREVIVQRAEAERREYREVREPREAREGRERGRGDEWADPWMRGEPAVRKRRPPSSEDSYSSSSSRSSRSPSARRKRRASSSSRQRVSPSAIVRERRMAHARATAMNPPAPRRRALSPAAARQLAANPPPPDRHKEEIDPYRKGSTRNRKRYTRSSSSGSESSSSSSESDSESRSSSSSRSSSEGARRGRHQRLLNAAAKAGKINSKSAGLAAAVSTAPGKREPPVEKGDKKRPASPSGNGPPAKKAVSRREELLKQLKAVEDAIARKRSKI